MMDKTQTGYRFRTDRGYIDKGLWDVVSDEEAKKYAEELKKDRNWSVKEVKIYRLYEGLEKVK